MWRIGYALLIMMSCSINAGENCIGVRPSETYDLLVMLRLARIRYLFWNFSLVVFVWFSLRNVRICIYSMRTVWFVDFVRERHTIWNIPMASIWRFIGTCRSVMRIDVVYICVWQTTRYGRSMMPAKQQGALTKRSYCALSVVRLRHRIEVCTCGKSDAWL